MTKKILVVMDPIENIKPYKDTSLAMLRAASARDWATFTTDTPELSVRDGKASALCRELAIHKDNQHYFELITDRSAISLADFDAIVMRKDPPFDLNFIYATYALELAECQGVMILNRPRALRDTNEKYSLSKFPQCAPKTLISADRQQLRDFHNELGDIIIKPLDGMGGEGIYRLKADDPNITMLLDQATDRGVTPIMAQQFLAQISDGDKRILMVNGKPLSHGLARIPKKGETRGNIAAGGTGVVKPINDRERWLAAQIGPHLVAEGLYFVGLDVIGDFVTEINVTSPTCAVEIAAETGEDATELLMDLIATN